MARQADHGQGRCPACGKVRYRTRKEARAAGRRHLPGVHVSAYECNNFWHIGNLPRPIVEGLDGRQNIYHRGMDYDPDNA